MPIFYEQHKKHAFYKIKLLHGNLYVKMTFCIFSTHRGVTPFMRSHFKLNSPVTPELPKSNRSVRNKLNTSSWGNLSMFSVYSSYIIFPYFFLTLSVNGSANKVIVVTVVDLDRLYSQYYFCSLSEKGRIFLFCRMRL